MTVKQIQEDIKREFGSSFISKSQAYKYLGFKKNAGMSFLASLPCYPTGKKILYSSLDIAKHMDSLRTNRPYGHGR